nr:isoprenylcysteine carboxylmethyltransferase family protein [Rhizomicrobium electricum]
MNHGASRVPETDSAGIVVLPPVVFLVCLVGGIATSFAYGGWITGVPAPFRWAAGGLVIVAGLAFAISALDRFRKLKVDVRPDRPVARMVGGGAYRVTRNPMYFGLISLLTGLGLAFGAVPMLLSAVVMFAYLNWYVIPREEAYLTRKFGDDYRTYCTRVRRWF